MPVSPAPPPSPMSTVCPVGSFAVLHSLPRLALLLAPPTPVPLSPGPPVAPCSLSFLAASSTQSFHGRHSSRVISHSLSPNASSAALPLVLPPDRAALRAYVCALARRGTAATGRALLLDVETSAWNPKDLVIFLYGRFSFHRIPRAILTPRVGYHKPPRGISLPAQVYYVASPFSPLL